MKKTIVKDLVQLKKAVVFAGLLVPACMHAQNTIVIAAGPSFPVGAYSNKDAGSTSSGLAGTGETVSISYTHLIKKQIGVVATLQGQRNPISTKAFTDQFFGFNNWNVKKASWWLGSLRVGGYGSFSTGSARAVSFNSKALVGIAYAKSPKLYARSESTTHIAEAKQTSESAIGLSFSISSGVKYQLNKKLFLSAEAELFATPKLKFKDVTSSSMVATFTSGGFPLTVNQMWFTKDARQAFTSVNLNFGIGIAL